MSRYFWQKVRIPHDATEQEALEAAYVAGFRDAASLYAREIENSTKNIVDQHAKIERTQLADLVIERDDPPSQEDPAAAPPRTWKSYRELHPLNPANEVPIEDVDLNVRTYNLLKYEGYNTMGDLPPIEILKAIKGFGRNSQLLLIDRLEVWGITLIADESS